MSLNSDHHHGARHSGAVASSVVNGSLHTDDWKMRNGEKKGTEEEEPKKRKKKERRKRTRTPSTRRRENFNKEEYSSRWPGHNTLGAT